MTAIEIQAEALSRARNEQSLANYPAIYAGFMAKGIAQSDIRPRENVFTFNAWKALGRKVRKGEHGVKVHTFLSVGKKVGEPDPETGEVKRVGVRRPWMTTVFHESQTEPVQA